jgi:hypothetical protein
MRVLCLTRAAPTPIKNARLPAHPILIGGEEGMDGDTVISLLAEASYSTRGVLNLMLVVNESHPAFIVGAEVMMASSIATNGLALG